MPLIGGDGTNVHVSMSKEVGSVSCLQSGPEFQEPLIAEIAVMMLMLRQKLTQAKRQRSDPLNLVLMAGPMGCGREDDSVNVL